MINVSFNFSPKDHLVTLCHFQNKADTHIPASKEKIMSQNPLPSTGTRAALKPVHMPPGKHEQHLKSCFKGFLKLLFVIYIRSIRYQTHQTGNKTPHMKHSFSIIALLPAQPARPRIQNTAPSKIIYSLTESKF